MKSNKHSEIVCVYNLHAVISKVVQRHLVARSYTKRQCLVLTEPSACMHIIIHNKTFVKQQWYDFSREYIFERKFND